MKLLKGATASSGERLVSVSKDCLSCSTQARHHELIPTLLKGLKMACLSYQPSKVNFEKSSFDRRELIDVQGCLLELASQHLKHLEFNQIEKHLSEAAF